MKNFLMAFGLFLLWSFFGMWYYAYIIKGISPEASAIEAVKTPKELEEENIVDAQIEAQRVQDSIARVEMSQNTIASKKIKVATLFGTRDFKVVNSSSGDTLVYYPNPVTIYKNRSKIYLPEPNRSFYNDIAMYFKEDVSAKLIIYAAYDANMENVDSDSLGLARAQYLKERLVRYGVSAEKIKTEAIPQNLNFDFKGRNYKGIYVEFETTSTQKPKRVQSQVETNIDNNEGQVVSLNRVLFEGFVDDTYKLTPELRSYAENLRDYLIKNSSRNVIVIGHTDNIGNDKDNEAKGLENATVVRNYLVSRGIASEKIKSISRGESSPLVPNTSDYNRSRNRRIEIKVN